MEFHPTLDAVGGATSRRLILLLLLLWLPIHGSSQADPSTRDHLAEVKRLYEAGRWDDIVAAIPESPTATADLELYRGLALAKLQRWEEARRAFEAGLARNPRDTRFRAELAGIAYRQNQFARAKRELRRALAIDPRDDYTTQFLASIYFLEGNLEAALEYWNRTGRPELADLIFDPVPRLKPLLLDRAFAFSRGSEWRRDQFLATQARLEALDVFPRMQFDLQARPDGAFLLGFYAAEREGLGGAKWKGAISLLRGLPYLSVYPEFYDLGGTGRNWLSLVRWDDEKRRVFSEISAPLAENPAVRCRLYFDGRNENWDLTRTLTPSLPSPAGLNLEKAAAGAEVRFIASGRWQWSAGFEYAYRKTRALSGIPAQAAPYFTSGSSLALRSGVQRSLVRFPERRLTLDSRAEGEFGTFFENPLGKYGRLDSALSANWFPQARGEDYQLQAGLQGGGTLGSVPFDELFMLGFDRDNHLWLRGHPGLRNGKKGNAPLGRNFVLFSGEMDKNLYQGAFFTLKLGPFLDTGKVYDPSHYFGSPKWLWDTGAQAKIRVLGSFALVLGYGKDLRSGTNSFFTTVSR